MDRIDRKKDTDFKYVQKQLNDVKDEISTFKNGLKRVLKTLKSDVYRRFGEIKALVRNRLCIRLDSSIYKIYTLVRDENDLSRYKVHPQFPVTIREFW